MIKQQIEGDLKKAMLDGNKELVSALKNLKSAIMYAEVATGKRESGLDEQTLISLLQKESKKRQDSADMYQKGGAIDRSKAELYEKSVIDAYLPEAMSEDEVNALIDEAVASLDGLSRQNMGQIIGSVKAKSGASADGGMIAKLVQSRL